MTLPLSSASQPIIHPAAPDGVPQAPFPFPPAALLRSHPRLHDAANELGLNLPPNTLSLLAHWQASGQLPLALDNPTQPATAVASGATLKSTARPRSQVSKSGRPPSRARKAPVPTPVPQPPAAAQYQPPPLKARARRAMLAAKSKRPKADTPGSAAAAHATASTSRNGCTKDLSTIVLQPALSVAERAREISQCPGLGDLPVKLIEKWIERTTGLAAEAQHHGHSSTWAASDTGASGTGAGADQLAHYEGTSAPIMEMPEIVTAPTCQLPGSSPPTEPSGPFPPVEQLAPAPTTEEDPVSGPSMVFPHWWSEYEVPELVTATELSGVGPPSVEPPPELEQPPAVTWEMFKNLDVDWENFFNFGDPNQV